ncbi:hypothetical protein [Phyllobacterium endophyticum]|uniref:hypothetical protein n=1 Tax=Phyllobacterium endophyticum TaxID=1149773 RepID=UPI0011B209AC|nr:hypothetical protein [Phyllobacterium endophyticum]MBB3236353.1 hypothetical protein [Phyllobacterium endophyticum]TYR39889.1 hypothetical protein FY050_19910 [Phyllobacterium endophyticum]
MKYAEPAFEPRQCSIPNVVDCIRRTYVLCRHRPRRGPLPPNHGPAFLVYEMFPSGKYVPEEYQHILIGQMMTPPTDWQREYIGRLRMWFAIARTQERSTRQLTEASRDDAYVRYSRFTDWPQFYTDFIRIAEADDLAFLADQGITKDAALLLDGTGRWEPMNLAAMPYKIENDKGLTGWTHI